MAFVRSEFCRVCKDDTSHTNGKCDVCVAIKECSDAKSFSNKSVDERLDEIFQRLKKLEAAILR